MKKYKVIRSFKDKTNNLRFVAKGGFYSHEDENRIAFLIENGFLEGKVEEPKEKYHKHVGGGYYELSNGEKVQGKKKAQQAENKLKSGE